ncbi:MAG: hypothetical protein PG981_000381 [Wolbachia endosymbiont of Ctenocephalides orientis wCori]|nr:MAG: hypothetical protein PG981_000381 [Wolbachia endosymbiont of Ctenocephalides orientis wCori]
MTAGQVSKLINSSHEEEANKIQELVEQKNKESLFNAVYKHIQVYLDDILSDDILNIVYGFTQRFKQPSPFITESLFLRNIAIFAALKISADDVQNSIAKYKRTYGLDYNLQADQQIQDIVRYEKLKSEFVGNKIDLSQYTEWYKNDYKESDFIDKIVELTGWRKSDLENTRKNSIYSKYFKKSTALNPIDPLVGIMPAMNSKYWTILILLLIRLKI